MRHQLGKRWEIGIVFDKTKWLLGFQLNIPRHTKYNFVLWDFVIALLPFALFLTRKNEHRVVKFREQPPIQAGVPE